LSGNSTVSEGNPPPLDVMLAVFYYIELMMNFNQPSHITVK